MGRKILRAVSLSIAACGIVLYLVFLSAWWLEWRQAGFDVKPLLEQIWFVVDHAIFLSGLPPLMLTIYFLLLKKSAPANLHGLVYVALFIPIHYYVAPTTAHSTPEIYLPAQFVELAFAVALIAVWKEEADASPN